MISSRTGGILALVGVLGWAGLIWLGVQLYSTNPPTAGFDLELLLRAGRDVAAGRSPYDPAMLAGSAPVAERLFYSYPPVVAQTMSLVAAIPSPVMFVAWAAAAVVGIALVGRALALRLGSSIPPNVVALSLVALTPLLSPFAVGLLFGNLDVFFPLAFGLLLLSVLDGGGDGARVVGGAATAIVAAAKLHPASLGVWLLARSAVRSDTRRVLVAAAVTLVAIVAVSVVVGGIGPWTDYVSVVRAGSGADLVDPRNAGPAAQIALLVAGAGSGADALARTLQIPVTIGAILVTIVVAIRVHDPVESLAWAAGASLVILPVTWYHYPSALIPFALAAVLRAQGPSATRVRAAVAAAAVVAAIAIAWLPLIYVAIGCVLYATRASRAGAAGAPGATGAPA